MARSIPAYQGISHVDPNWLEEALRLAPSFNSKVSSAISRVIRCIHGLEKLHRTVHRDALEIYIGRATETTLEQRWKAHAKHLGRKHQFGAILFTCEPARVERLEHLAVKIIAQLKKRALLCVGNANVSDGNRGLQPRSECAIVYMTWRIIDQTSDWAKPSLDQIKEIAGELRRELTDDIKRLQIQRGLMSLKRLSERDPLHWWCP